MANVPPAGIVSVPGPLSVPIDLPSTSLVRIVSPKLREAAAKDSVPFARSTVAWLCRLLIGLVPCETVTVMPDWGMHTFCVGPGVASVLQLEDSCQAPDAALVQKTSL